MRPGYVRQAAVQKPPIPLGVVAPFLLIDQCSFNGAIPVEQLYFNHLLQAQAGVKGNGRADRVLGDPEEPEPVHIKAGDRMAVQVSGIQEINCAIPLAPADYDFILFKRVIQGFALQRPTCLSIQSMGLKIESSIHIQPIVPRAMGAVHGSKIKKRASHLPRKSLIRANARILASTRTST